jgi:hypothetical protein
MSQREHQAAIASALATGDKLLVLFDGLGGRQSPARGVWAAYALARQTLAGHLDDTRLVNRTLAHLRETTRAIVEKQIAAAIRVGEKQAEREIALYDDLPRVEEDTDPLLENAMLAFDADIDAQLARVRALIMTTGDENMVLGDDANVLDASRTGVLRASDATLSAMNWITTGAVLAFALYANKAARESEKGNSENAQARWNKQAIAALDNRTTDCCLQVHGQAVPLDAKFILTGTPRFADEQDAPPFHWNCRTAFALVRAEDSQDDLTKRMQDAAQNELDARAKNDTRDYKFPVDAFTGRL